MTQRTADVINKPGDIKQDHSPKRTIKNKVADIDRAIIVSTKGSRRDWNCTDEGEKQKF